MQTGTVTDWNCKTGTGFIRPDFAGGRVYLHRRAFADGRMPAVGDRVEFEAAMRDRGLYALQARVL